LLLRRATGEPMELYDDKRIAEFAADEAAIGKLLRPVK
jgi:hypothetical protein